MLSLTEVNSALVLEVEPRLRRRDQYPDSIEGHVVEHAVQRPAEVGSCDFAVVTVPAPLPKVNQLLQFCGTPRILGCREEFAKVRSVRGAKYLTLESLSGRCRRKRLERKVTQSHRRCGS
jgi:hypothetical protein